MKRKVVITGISLLTPLGLTTNETWENLIYGKSGLSPISDTQLIKLGVKEAGRILAIKNSNNRWLTFFNLLFNNLVNDNKSIKDKIIKSPLLIGSSFFGIENGTKNISINKIGRAIKHYTKGKISFYSSACASGNSSLISGYRLIQSKLTDMVICAGIDVLSDFLFAGFYGLRNLATKHSTPFSKNRSGLTLGEGGGMIILESLESALNRNAKIYSQLIGAAERCDITGITKPDKEGTHIELTIRDALIDAKIEPKKIDCINSHGTGTILNDKAESMAISRIFKHKPTIQAFKSFWGHAMGASSIMEAGLTALSIDKSFLIKIRGLDDPVDGNNFLLVNKKGQINYAINNAFGFGGINTAVIFKRFT